MHLDKRSVMQALLMQASSVFVHLDPRHAAAAVPPQFRSSPLLVLEIGMNMVRPIPDLRLEEDGINATLSFGGRPFQCWLPWDAIFALVTPEKKAMVWQNDVPQELVDKQPGLRTPSKPRAKPKLVASDGKMLTDTPEAPESPDQPDDPVADALPNTADTEPTSPQHARADTADTTKAAEPETASDTPQQLDTAKADTPDTPSTENAAPSQTPHPDDKPGKRKLPSYLRIVK